MRHHYVKATVKVRQYPDGTLAIFHGPRRWKVSQAAGGAIPATVTKRNLSLHFMAPQVTYSFVRNASNSAFDDYTSHNVDARLLKEF